jgi:hypothetical protein
MSNRPLKCETGCMIFHGGEIKHHVDCVFYPESLTELHVKELTNLRAALDESIKVIQFYASKSSWLREPDADVARKIYASDTDNVPGYAKYTGGKTAREFLSKHKELIKGEA